MRSIPTLKFRSRARLIAGIWIFVIVIIFVGVLFANAHAQCVNHPDKKTALKFSNESRFELTFFVDDDEKGVVVPSKSVSNEIGVDPDEHMLRARGILRGESFWVWAINEVPQGQVCTWTIEDPSRAVDVNKPISKRH